MKILTLLRHAKSDWNDPVARDFDRPLNKRGRRAARTMGRAMRAEGLVFDAVIASPAVRVVETLAELASGYGEEIAPTYDERVYLASPATLIALAQTTDDGVRRLLIVGHNPGLEQLALQLTDGEETRLRAELALKYPTATLAEIELPIAHWGELSGSGRLTRFVRPRDLDPDLGPDS